jgi:1-aminocyclopropane-1-carboxylate deaminase/D-cysteine desulfhydrase-like pyridoxal-dependent ACC family enzyme
MGGNKVRNCEFWFGEALERECDLVLVAGAPVSNQCRLVAAAACKIGLECHILYAASQPPALTGNFLLTHIMGVKCVWLGAVSEEERAQRTLEYAERMKQEGRRPYIAGAAIPGALGYVNAALELHTQAGAGGLDIRHVLTAGSMGTTEAGLLWGSALLGGAFKLHVPSVEYGRDELLARLSAIYEAMSERLGVTPPVSPGSLLHIYDEFLGPGYDVPTPESLAATRRLASREGIFIENTYNGKVFAALEALIERKALPPGEGVCVFHTGGLPALFAQGERFSGDTDSGLPRGAASS